jgi:hypothetical protein
LVFKSTSSGSVISELLVISHGLGGSFNVGVVRGTSEGELEDNSTEVSNFGFKGVDFSVDSSFKFSISGLSLLISSSFDGKGVFEVFFNIVKDSHDGINHSLVTLSWGSFSNRG